MTCLDANLIVCDIMLNLLHFDDWISIAKTIYGLGQTDPHGQYGCQMRFPGD